MSAPNAWSIDPGMPTPEVARSLLGAELHVIGADGAHASGRIVETEAYLGLRDPAAHSFHGKRTGRVAAMYAAAGHVYVYRIYGIHLCMNVVTREAGVPEAVLLRAVVPLSGLTAMRTRRGRVVADAELARGPGNLTRALAVEASHDGQRLDRPPLWIAAGADIPDDRVGVSARIGMAPTQPSRAWPLRFFVTGEPAVSGGRRPQPGAWGPTPP